MKSNKISTAFLAIALFSGTSTYTVGGFFTAPRKILFSKIMNGLQWTFFVGTGTYDLLNLKKRFAKEEASLNAYPDYDILKTEYLANKEANLTQNRVEIPANDLDKMNAAYVRKVIGDDSVSIKYSHQIKDRVVAFHNPFTGNSYIALPANGRIPDGVLHHEYEHIKNNHVAKREIFNAVTPLSAHTFFKGTRALYKGVRYGHSAAKNAAPSIASTFLKIPGTLATLMTCIPLSAYLERCQERQADDAIPAALAGEVADLFDRWRGPQPSTPPLWLRTIINIFSTHPPLNERIKKLRERAALIAPLKK